VLLNCVFSVRAVFLIFEEFATSSLMRVFATALRHSGSSRALKRGEEVMNVHVIKPAAVELSLAI